MRTLCDNIYDLVQNSIKAEATWIHVGIIEDKEKNELRILIEDNGKGIPEEHLKNVRNPFFTTQESREKHVGLGIPLLDAECERANGRLDIESKINEGTKLLAILEYDNIDRPPVGDVVGVFTSLVTQPGTNIQWHIEHQVNERRYSITNEKLQARLGFKRLDDLESYRIIKKVIKEKEARLTKDGGKKRDRSPSKKKKKGFALKSLYR